MSTLGIKSVGDMRSAQRWEYASVLVMLLFCFLKFDPCVVALLITMFMSLVQSVPTCNGKRKVPRLLKVKLLSADLAGDLAGP